MHRSTVRAFLLALAALTAAVAIGPTSASAACKAGVHPFGSVQARTFCGPASMTATVAGKKISLKGGECTRTAGEFTLNIGTIVLGTAPKRPDYFGITIGSTSGTKPAGHDGTYRSQGVVALVSKRKGYATIRPVITLKGGRTRGTFTSSLLGASGTVSGTFTCR